MKISLFTYIAILLFWKKLYSIYHNNVIYYVCMRHFSLGSQGPYLLNTFQCFPSLLHIICTYEYSHLSCFIHKTVCLIPFFIIHFFTLQHILAIFPDSYSNGIYRCLIYISSCSPDVVAHAFNPSTVGRGRQISESRRLACSTEHGPR